MKISVVIPAHNEEQNIENIVKLLFRNFRSVVHEVIIVNDCSTDHTKEILTKLSKSHKKIIPVHRKHNPGVGNAIREGLKKISSKSDYVLLLDCDFVENIKDIRKMIGLAHTADGLLGSRFIKSGILVNYPIVKKIANRTFHKLMRLVLNIGHIDISNNFKLYKRHVIIAIQPYLKSSGFSINAETGIYPILMGYKLKEVPVSWIGRTPEMGKSSFNVIKAGPGYVKVLIDVIKYKYMKTDHNHANGTLQHSEKTHFDTLVSETGETYYGNLRPIAPIRFRRKANAILEELKTFKNPKVLELGCGTGILSQYLLENNSKLRIEGIDISPKAIGVARKTLRKYKNAHFQAGDALHLPFKSNTFDVVVGNSILHHIPLVESLQEVRRVLKPNGKIWFCEPNMLNPQIAVEKNIPFLKSFFQDSEDERAFSRWGIKSDLKKYGFKKIVVTPYEFLHPIAPKSLLPIFVPFAILLEHIPVIREFAGTMQIVGFNSKRK